MVAAAVVLFGVLLGAAQDAVAEPENRETAVQEEPASPPSPPATNRRQSPAANKLPPAVRMKLMMLLVLVVFLGFMAVLAIVAGGRWLRFYMHRSDDPTARLPRQTVDEDDWAKKPMIPSDSLTDDDPEGKSDQ